MILHLAINPQKRYSWSTCVNTRPHLDQVSPSFDFTANEEVTVVAKY